MWYSEEGTGRGRIQSRPLLTVTNVTAPPVFLTANVPFTVLLYTGLLLYIFSVPVKGLILAVLELIGRTIQFQLYLMLYR